MPRSKPGHVAIGCMIASAVLAAACQSSKPSTTGTPTTTTAAVSTTTATATATGSNGATFSVRPAALMVGRTVTVSGTECPRADAVLVFIGSLSSATSGTDIEITKARTDSMWTASVPVADGTTLGRVPASATCVVNATHAPVFQYPTLTVHVATFRSVHVAPGTTVRAGTTLTVSSSTPCPAPAIDYPMVTLSPAKPDGSPIDQNRGGTQSPSGNWTVTITVPAGSAAGTRTLSSLCEYGRGYMAFCPGVTITVTP